VNSGEPFTYTIVVTNVGDAGADPVRMIDTLPVNFTYVGHVTNRGTCVLVGPVTGGVLDCDLADIGLGLAAFAQIEVTGYLTSGFTITVDNDAEVDPFDLIPEQDESNNEVTEDTTVLVSTATPSETQTATATATAASTTDTPTASPSSTTTPTGTVDTPTTTPTATASDTPDATVTATATDADTPTPTVTPSATTLPSTATVTASATPSVTPSPTPSDTPDPLTTPTQTVTPTATAEIASSPTPASAQTETPGPAIQTVTPTSSDVPDATVTPSDSTVTPTPSDEPAPPPASFPDGEAVIIVADDSTPTVGDSVTITVAVVQADGTNVVGVTCLLNVSSQPGNDAWVEEIVLVTGADGEATTTLQVGSTPGTVEVTAQCGSEVGFVTVNVSAAAGAPDSPDQGEPPASLPDAGSGAGTLGARPVGLLPMLMLALSGLLVAAAAFVRLRRETVVVAPVAATSSQPETRQADADAYVPRLKKLF